MSRIAIMLVLALATHAIAAPTFVSPGPLARPHAMLEARCDACHVPYRGIPDDRCLRCHAPIADQVKVRNGLHGDLQGASCASCHPDHLGPAHALSPPVPARIAHDRFPLVGKHAAVACASCHPRGYVGTPTACVRCHVDRHQGALGSDCAACHSTTSFVPTIHPPGAHRTPMTGAHAPVACDGCHKRGRNLSGAVACATCHDRGHGGTDGPCEACHSTRSWAQLDFDHKFCSCILPGKHQTAPCLACHADFKFQSTPTTCAGCHERERKHDPLGACARCHTPRKWKPATFDHDRKPARFALTGQHATVGCDSCHTRPEVFRGTATECRACHAVPSHGEFGACDRCHTTRSFTPSSFSHATTSFPIDGRHAGVACASCHLKLPAAPITCASCHATPHSPKVSATCTQCHVTSGWKPSTITAATHATFGFPLVSKHASVACADCHANGQLTGLPTRCADCHADRRHRGRLGDRCERCHTPAGFTAPPDFAHARETGFALTVAHATAPCASCHGAGGLALVSRTTAPTCATCHVARIHGEQFGTRCEQCHSPTTFANVKPFEHATTDFPLERRHRTLQCTACHDTRVRRVVNSACVTCHGDPHRTANAFACEDCHRADRWRVIRFDHDRTDFPLTGRHVLAACGGCHTNPIWTGVSGECLACHARDRPNTRDHLLRSECAECHTTRSWRTIK